MKAALFLVLCLTLGFPGWLPAQLAEPGNPAESGPPAEPVKPHPIDAKIDALMEKDPSTHGQVWALDEGLKLWDQELNRVYQELRNALKADPEAPNILKNAQLAWIKTRDADFALIDTVFSRKEGTMFRPMAIGAKLELVKKRALELADRLAILNEY
jgi:uncharacterized protein YecT (DUF1311 family)